MSISASGCLSHPVQVHEHLLSQHCPAFSVHGWNYNNVQHKKSYTSHPNTHQRRKSSSPASIAASCSAASVLFQEWGQGAAIQTTLSPLKSCLCTQGKSESPNRGSKGDKRSGRNFILNSHKKLLPAGTRCHHIYFSLLSLDTKIYHLDFTAVP